MKEWEHCPRCGSKSVVQMGKIMMSFIISCVGTLALFVAGLLSPLFFIGIPIVWLIAIANLFLGKNFLQCKDCNHGWNPKNKQNESMS